MMLSLAASACLLVLWCVMLFSSVADAQSYANKTQAVPKRDLPLANVSVRCCTIDWWPYTFANKQREPPYDGWTMIYFNRLLEITGLQCSEYHKWIGKTNEYVNMLASCATNDSEEACPCHFGPTALWENPTRTNVTFLPDIGYDSIFVVTPVHNTTPLMPSNFVFNAFSATVWVCIAVLVVMFTVMKMLDPRFSPKDAYTWNDTMQHQQHQLRRRYTMNGFRHGNGDGGSVVDQRERQSNGNKVSDMTERSTGQLKKAASKSKRVAARSKYFALKSRHVYRLRKAFQSTVGTLIGHHQHFHGEDRSTRMWVINIIIMMSGIFLVLVYEASMTSLLVQEGRGSRFESIANLENCDVSDDEVCFKQGDSMETFWNNTMRHRPCRDATRDTIYPRLEKDFDQLIEAVLVKRTCKYMLADGGTAAKAVNGRQCGQLVTTGTEFLTRSMAFATPKNWTHSDVLAKAMLTVHNGHQLPSFQEYVDQFHTCAQTTLPTISVARLKVFFGLAFTFGACILMGMIIDPQKPVNGGNEPDVSVISSSSGDERDNEDGDGDEDDVEMLSEEEDVEEGRGGVGGDQRGGHGNGADGDDDGDGVEGKVVNGTQKDMDEEDGNVLEQDSMKTTFRDESSSSSTTKPK